MSTYRHKSASELEQELEMDRQRIQQRVGMVQNRLSPGRLLDEALSYTKGGSTEFATHFATNLGNSLSANPIPAALLGVSLAWLFSGMKPHVHVQDINLRMPHRRPEPQYPYATLSGTRLRRTSHVKSDAGEWISHFADDTGRTFKAKSNEIGERAGHFVDDAGKTLSGFIDAAGNRITDFQDEAGTRIDDAKGWASHTWSDAQDAVSGAAGQVAEGARNLGQQFAGGVGQQAANVRDQAMHLGSDMQAQMDQTTRQIMKLFEDQPLIAGALAFAAGAALGAAVPRTAEENQLFGQTADQLKDTAAKAAGELYEQGKQKVAEVYDEAKQKSGELYEQGKQQAADAYDQGKQQAQQAYRKLDQQASDAMHQPSNGANRSSGLH